MSAAEIIELIKNLPPEERAKVVAYVRHAANDSAPPADACLPQAEAERIAKEVFADHRELFRRLAQ